jgi:hypothetical protein
MWERVKAWLGFGPPVPLTHCWKCRTVAYVWRPMMMRWPDGRERPGEIEMCPRCWGMGRMKPLPEREPAVQWRPVGAAWEAD